MSRDFRAGTDRTPRDGRMGGVARADEEMVSMASKDSFGAKGSLDVGGTAYEIFRLDAVTGDGLDVESAGTPTPTRTRRSSSRRRG
jgi:hypothetical protein